MNEYTFIEIFLDTKNRFLHNLSIFCAVITNDIGYVP